jgi:hypothetical protein
MVSRPLNVASANQWLNLTNTRQAACLTSHAAIMVCLFFPHNRPLGDGGYKLRHFETVTGVRH